MITENLSTLKIHKLTQEQYDREVEAGRIDDNAIYLTPDEYTDMSRYATQEQISSLSSEIANKSAVGHKHTKSEITDFPTSMTPAAHNQAASTITAGTFAGQVIANANGQATGTSCLRNSKLVSADTNPTVNGEICWTYK